MKVPRCGVMIARGDLAVECGFERMAEVQTEMLWICEAGACPSHLGYTGSGEPCQGRSSIAGRNNRCSDGPRHRMCYAQ